MGGVVLVGSVAKNTEVTCSWWIMCKKWQPFWTHFRLGVEGTNLDSFEANWILELDLALDPTSLHLDSSNHKLSFLALFFSTFGLNQLIFTPKWCHLDLASIHHFLVLDPHLKVTWGPIYDSHPIGLLYFLGPYPRPWILI